MGSLPGLSEVESIIGIEAGRSSGALMVFGIEGVAVGEVGTHLLSCIDIPLHFFSCLVWGYFPRFPGGIPLGAASLSCPSGWAHS